MDHLASCYFCGTALDDPLQDYRVVPAELRDDDVTTATLCSSCHGKLERLLEPVVEAAGESSVTLETYGARTDADTARAESEREHDSTEAPEPETAGDDATAGGDPDLVDVDGHDADEGEDPLATGAGADERQSGDSADTPDAEPAQERGGDPREEAAETADSDDPDEDATARTTISALEYNKVMRLLQNRDLPVDRAEIQAVAANAYGLAEHECAEVIDLAIDRGLIAERDGQLVRPE